MDPVRLYGFQTLMTCGQTEAMDAAERVPPLQGWLSFFPLTHHFVVGQTLRRAYGA